MDTPYDLLVIGAGSGGVRAARMAAGYGARVGLCEDMRVGGTCVMRGCVPKKLLFYGTGFADSLTDAAAAGWNVSGQGELDWSCLMALKEAELNRLEEIYHTLLKDVDLYHERGQLQDANTVVLAPSGRTLRAKHILIATGGWPAMPKISGIEHAITSNEALSLPRLPAHITVVGGGYIAVELAGVFASAGAAVTQVIRADNILRGFDEDIRTHLHDAMEERGIEIRNRTNITAIVSRDVSHEARIYGLETDTGVALETECVLYATGRKPKTDGLGLGPVGVQCDENGAIVVDDDFRTSVPSIYAIGDVINRVTLTPVAIQEAMVLTAALFSTPCAPMSYEMIPTAVFSHPPVGTIGMTEQQARTAGTHNAVDIYKSTFRPMKNILTGRMEKDFVKLIADAQTGRVLGLHMIGHDAPEIIQGFAVAMKMGATKADFDACIGVHPSAAEEIVTLRTKA